MAEPERGERHQRSASNHCRHGTTFSESQRNVHRQDAFRSIEAFHLESMRAEQSSMQPLRRSHETSRAQGSSHPRMLPRTVSSQ